MNVIHIVLIYVCALLSTVYWGARSISAPIIARAHLAPRACFLCMIACKNELGLLVLGLEQRIAEESPELLVRPRSKYMSQE